ncbi:MAG: potassium transporter TrkG, partial [Candidatus Porifericomitaceae bacterium WSBS_2022_MAG_OTU9]
MQLTRIIFVIGMLVVLYSLIAFLPPMLVSWLLHDGQVQVFRNCLFTSCIFGATLCAIGGRSHNWDMRMRDGIIVVVLFWLTVGSIGTLPFLLQPEPLLSISNSMFESFSGLTTTGASVITDIDALPQSILFYRQLSQWLGGMGIIILAVAILPIIGVGGMQLYRVEIPGPAKDTKLTPRIASTAKSLWYIYMLLTICCAIGYMACGMNLLDAINYSFSTVSIGGFSPHSGGISAYPGNGVKIVAMVFMLISGMNFALHFIAIGSLRFRTYWRDAECNTYIHLHISLAIVCCLYMTILLKDSVTVTPSYIDIAFQSISIATTSGFTLASYHQWPEFILLLLLFASFIGASAGSVGGGLKVIRVYLLFKQGS